MDAQVIDALLATMTPDELILADRYVRLFEWVGMMTNDEAAEWQRRIHAWQGFVLDPTPSLPN